MLDAFKKILEEETNIYRLPVKYAIEYSQFSTDESFKNAVIKTILDKFYESFGDNCFYYSVPDFKQWVLSETFWIPENTLVIDWQAVALHIDNENVSDMYEFLTQVEFKELERPESFMVFLKKIAESSSTNT